MVDAEDLKSFGHCDRVGSSPTIPTTLRVCDASCGRPQFAYVAFLVAESSVLDV